MPKTKVGNLHFITILLSVRLSVILRLYGVSMAMYYYAAVSSTFHQLIIPYWAVVLQAFHSHWV
jgi:hypothetical protein